MSALGKFTLQLATQVRQNGVDKLFMVDSNGKRIMNQTTTPASRKLQKKLQRAYKLRKQDRSREALVLADEVFREGLQTDAVDRLRADLLLESKQWADAMEPLKSLQNRNPYDPAFYVKMSFALSKLGLPDQQLEVIDVGLHHVPHDPTLLASVMKFRMLKQHELTALENAFPTLPEGDSRAHAAITLARIYQHFNHHEMAFNLLKAETAVLAKRPDGMRPRMFEMQIRTAKVDGSLAPSLARGQEVGNSDPLEVLIIGFSRSGKSLVESLLALHTSIRAGGEMTHLGPSIKTALQDSGYSDYLAYLREADADTLARHAKWYRERLLAVDRDHLITDTMPSNLVCLPITAVWAPRTPVIMVRRSLNDLAAACFFSYYTRNHGFSYDLGRLGRMIASYHKLQDLLAEEIPNPVIWVNYEDMVSDIEGTAKRLYDFLGLDWQAEYLQGLNANRGMEKNLQPFISHDVPMPIRNDFIGWSEPYHEALAPVREAYEAEMRGEISLQGGEAADGGVSVGGIKISVKGND